MKLSYLYIYLDAVVMKLLRMEYFARISVLVFR